MNAFLFLVGLLALAASWISALAILGKLKAEGYQYSDLFYLDMYLRYSEIAPQRGWSRIPIFVLPFGGVCCGLLWMLLAACRAC